MSTSNSIPPKNKRGGRREGAGRPKGSGKFKEPTKAIRVPEGSIAYIHDFLDRYTQAKSTDNQPNSGKDAELFSFNEIKIEARPVRHEESALNRLELPVYSSKVAAGIPSPAEDHVDEVLDLNDYMVRKPDSTYMLRVEGESMKDIGILPNDILVVDRSLPAIHNKIVIAAIDGELTVKRLFHRGGLVKLLPENSAYPEIELESESDLVIWGVVVGSFRRFQTF